MRNALEIRGFKILKSFLDRAQQQHLLSVLRPVLHAAPLFSPDTPYGRRMSVRMTSAGAVGWFSDRGGYRYVDRHPGGAVWLGSGDVVVMGGAARLAYHGVDRIRFGSSGLLSKGGRINLTLRVAT